jgi:hypothetical protein
LPATPTLVCLAPAPTAGLLFAPAPHESLVAHPSAALALVAPVARAQRTRYVHLRLVTQVYRNAEVQPLARLAVLRDRDCLTYHVQGQVRRLFFDAFTRPAVQVCAGPVVECGFCREPIEHTLAVNCPGCGIWFHQDQAAACWLTSPSCPQCGQPTALDRAAAWLPEGFAPTSPSEEGDDT